MPIVSYGPQAKISPPLSGPGRVRS